MKFICGDAFKEKANLVLDNIYKGIDGELDCPDVFKAHGWKHDDVIFYEKENGSNIIFCRTDFLPQLDADIDFTNQILITHNSDININNEIQLKTKPKFWLSQNGNHQSVYTIPLGLENERFGKWTMFTELRKERVDKTQLLYLNVSPNSNPTQRYNCIIRAQSFGILNDFKLSTDSYMVDQLRYLKQIQKSHFVLCPEGAGIDTHRAFEALYLGAIPIVTRSRVTEELSSMFPLAILESWDEFNPSLYTEEFYTSLWKPELVENLDFDIYWDKITGQSMFELLYHRHRKLFEKLKEM